jgi:hypothetical protein
MALKGNAEGASQVRDRERVTAPCVDDDRRGRGAWLVKRDASAGTGRRKDQFGGGQAHIIGRLSHERAIKQRRP